MDITARKELIALNYAAAMVALSQMVNNSYHAGIRTDYRLHEAMNLIIGWNNDAGNFFTELENKKPII